MTTRLLHASVISLAFFSLVLPANAGFAPEKVNSIAIEVTGKKATYKDDLDTWTVSATPNGLKSGVYKYSRSSGNVGILEYFNEKSGSETYSGAFTLNFTSATGGSFYDKYTGTYSGYVKGTFTVVSMDVAARPKAVSKLVKVNKNQNKSFRLKGVARDIGKSGLKYQIVQQPDVGNLNAKHLPNLVYKPKHGFTGVVKFKFRVKEGDSKSKTATVKLVVK